MQCARTQQQQQQQLAAANQQRDASQQPLCSSTTTSNSPQHNRLEMRREHTANLPFNKNTLFLVLKPNFITQRELNHHVSLFLANRQHKSMSITAKKLCVAKRHRQSEQASSTSKQKQPRTNFATRSSGQLVLHVPCEALTLRLQQPTNK